MKSLSILAQPQSSSLSASWLGPLIVGRSSIDSEMGRRWAIRVFLHVAPLKPSFLSWLIGSTRRALQMKHYVRCRPYQPLVAPTSRTCSGLQRYRQLVAAAMRQRPLVSFESANSAQGCAFWPTASRIAAKANECCNRYSGPGRDSAARRATCCSSARNFNPSFVRRSGSASSLYSCLADFWLKRQ